MKLLSYAAPSRYCDCVVFPRQLFDALLDKLNCATTVRCVDGTRALAKEIVDRFNTVRCLKGGFQSVN